MYRSSYGPTIDGLQKPEVIAPGIWVAAPIFCPETARDALALPSAWLPHALVLVGRPDPTYVGRQRPPVPLTAPDEDRFGFAHLHHASP